MTLNKLLEERADRGTPRGSAVVWAATQEQLNNERRPRSQGSATGFRVALAFSAAALAMFVGIRFNAFTPNETQVAPITDENEAAIETKPAPILIDGMTLTSVLEPWTDSERDGTTFTTGSGATSSVISTRVYASAANRFAGPVVGIDTLEGGGFAPWSANLTTEELTSLTSEMVRDGGSWVLPDGGGLVEVAQFEDTLDRFMADGWQFDFSEGSNGATLQAEEGATVWVWLGRLLRFRSAEEQLAVVPIEVLGRSGLAVDETAVWEDSGYVYRLTADEIRGDTSYARPVNLFVDRLEVVERAEWEAAVNRAQRVLPWVDASAIVVLLGLIVWLMTAKKLVGHNTRLAVLAAGIGFGGIAVYWVLGPVLWLPIGLLVVAVATLRWVRGTYST